MASLVSKTSVTRGLISRIRAPSIAHTLCTATETRTQKLERIADQLLDLNKLEKHDYAILFRHKMGLNRYGPAVSGLGSSGPSSGPAAAEAKAEEKTIFDVKLEKFDAAAKIKVIKEIRAFTDLGLKEAKELVEKAPAVVKKGVTKDEANAIIEKLKAIGATAVLEWKFSILPSFVIFYIVILMGMEMEIVIHFLMNFGCIIARDFTNSNLLILVFMCPFCCL